MKVNGQLENAQLEITSGVKTPGTKGKVEFNTDCDSATLDTGSEITRIQDGRDMPIGSILMWPADNLPSDRWIRAQGQALLKTDYPELDAVLNGIYGSDATTFNLPDYRGQFIRGHESVIGDIAKNVGNSVRIDRGDGNSTTGAGSTFQHFVGTTQEDGVKDHTHEMLVERITATAAVPAIGDPAISAHINIIPGGPFDRRLETEGVKLPTFSEETRPCNITVDFLIKVK